MGSIEMMENACLQGGRCEKSSSKYGNLCGFEQWTKGRYCGWTIRNYVGRSRKNLEKFNKNVNLPKMRKICQVIEIGKTREEVARQFTEHYTSLLAERVKNAKMKCEKLQNLGFINEGPRFELQWFGHVAQEKNGKSWGGSLKKTWKFFISL